MKTKICPTCKSNYEGLGALSRKDNKTEVCSQCGLNEALEQAGIQMKTCPMCKGSGSMLITSNKQEED